MIKAVIFDMDGVLIDSEPIYLQRKKEYLERNGIHIDDEMLEKFVGKRFIQTISEPAFHLSEETIEILRNDFAEIIDLDYQALLFPDVSTTMQNLRIMGIKLAIASNSSIEKIQTVIKICRLEEYVEAYVSGSLVLNLKPAPDIYQEAARRLGCKPEECIAVEDSDIGIQSAADAGCYVIAKRNGRFSFSQNMARKKINTLRELEQIIKYMEGTEDEAAGNT